MRGSIIETIFPGSCEVLPELEKLEKCVNLLACIMRSCPKIPDASLLGRTEVKPAACDSSRDLYALFC